MSEEVKTEINEQKCFCKSEFAQRTVAVAVGSFIGVFCALNLFCATHKPPMMMHNFGMMQGQHRFMPNKPIRPHDFNPNDFDKSIHKNKPENIGE